MKNSRESKIITIQIMQAEITKWQAVGKERQKKEWESQERQTNRDEGLTIPEGRKRLLGDCAVLFSSHA